MTEKKFPPSILPTVASPAEKAIDRASADVLAAIPVNIIRWVKNPDECPAELLPWLAWERRVDTWNTDWTEQEKRNAIKRAPYIHRHRGTAAAVRHALADSPFGSEIVEWFNQNPPGRPYTFRLNVQQKDLPVSELSHQDLKQAVLRAKNLRSWFSVHIFGRKEGQVFGYGYLQVSETLKTRIQPSLIRLTPESLVLTPGETQTVQVNVLPRQAEDRRYVATSGNEAIATTTVTGEQLAVTGVASGESAVALRSLAGSAVAALAVRVLRTSVSVTMNITDPTAPLFALLAASPLPYVTVDGRPLSVVADSTGLVYAASPLPVGVCRVGIHECEQVTFFKNGVAFANTLRWIHQFSSNRTNMVDTFRDCTGLQGIDAGAFAGLQDVAAFINTFMNCTALASLPAGVFDLQAKVVSYSATFYGCRSLTTLPAGLFAGSPMVSSFASVFSGSGVISLPPDLFAGKRYVFSYLAAFSGCQSLSSVPAGLFAGNVSATSFFSAFSYCPALQVIPAGLFDDCLQVTEFSNCFKASGVITVPPGLFGRNASARTFVSVFGGCTSLAGNLNSLCDPASWPQVTDVSGMFWNCRNLTGSGQAFISALPAVVAHSTTLTGCTSLTDYVSLPADWV